LKSEEPAMGRVANGFYNCTHDHMRCRLIGDGFTDTPVKVTKPANARDLYGFLAKIACSNA
ncbi:hypothetical protein, partial [Arsenicicoccus sp. UBA2120]